MSPCSSYHCRDLIVLLCNSSNVNQDRCPSHLSCTVMEDNTNTVNEPVKTLFLMSCSFRLACKTQWKLNFCLCVSKPQKRAETTVCKPSANAKVPSHFAPWRKHSLEAGGTEILFFLLAIRFKSSWFIIRMCLMPPLRGLHLVEGWTMGKGRHLSIVGQRCYKDPGEDLWCQTDLLLIWWVFKRYFSSIKTNSISSHCAAHHLHPQVAGWALKRTSNKNLMMLTNTSVLHLPVLSFSCPITGSKRRRKISNEALFSEETTCVCGVRAVKCRCQKVLSCEI